MRNSAARINLWLIMGGLVCQRAAAQQTPSYFGSSSPIQSTEAVILQPATTLSPKPPPVIQVPAPSPGNGTEGTPTHSVEETKLAEALGLPTYPNEEFQEKFRRFLQVTSGARIAAALTYGQQLDVVRRCLQDHRTQDAFRALQSVVTDNAVDGHADADLAAWVRSAWALHYNIVAQGAKDEKIRTTALQAAAAADILTAGTASTIKTKTPTNLGQPLPTVTPVPPPIRVVTENAEIEKKLQLKIEQLKVAEGQQQLDENQSTTQKSVEDSDAYFTELVNRLFAEHKYDQVVLALPFYQQIFGTERCPLGTVEKAIEAQAVVGRVNTLAKIAAAKSKTNEIVAMTAALYAAFVDGGYEPVVTAFDGDLRTRVETFLTRVEAIRHSLENRDFDPAGKYAEEISKVAPDFNPAKLLALLRTYQAESKFHIDSAATALQKKQFRTSRVEWQAAKKAWCNNPALDAFPESIRTQSDVSKLGLEFDHLFIARDFRSLVEKRSIFNDCLEGDSVRLAQLQDAVESVQRLDFSIAQINKMREAGDAHGAWECAENAAKEWPDDATLSGLFTRLSSEDATYISIIKKARLAETLKQYGYSLEWYVAAKRIYPASVQVREALARLTYEVCSSTEARPASMASASQ